MTDKEKALNHLYDLVADELSISPSRLDAAISGYTAVGEWLGGGIDNLTIMPQGSMNLGTVIRPVNDSEDFDIDLVCLIEDGTLLPAKTIKHLVGDRLKENGTYKPKLDKEGKRCWTLEYSGFHMDILPCVPKYTRFLKPSFTQIRLTHTSDFINYSDRFSDPYGYHEWFEKQMEVQARIAKAQYAQRTGTTIDKVPMYRIKTPLQKAIQLLKRHRDKLFENDGTNAPISIIITTLAAYAYDGQDNVWDALTAILARMKDHIQIINGRYVITNPVIAEENFADKWNEKPEKSTAFFTWLAQAKSDLLSTPLSSDGIPALTKALGDSLGEAPVKRAISRLGAETRNSREQGNLYLSGLMGGISTQRTSSSKPVKDHTFYGE